MMATTATAATRRRPLVVLAGWLGSQPKSLRRYEDLYKKIGFEVVLTRVAPPNAVVQSVLQLDEPVQPPAGWPYRSMTHYNYYKQKTIQDIAWDILRDVHNEDCSVFYFHAFSNGGCFVWEQIRRILSLEQSTESSGSHITPPPTSHERTSLFSSETVEILSSLREKLTGVVFDSSPIVELNRVDEALKHCTWVERATVVRHCGLDYLYMKDDPDIQARVQRRIESYITGLREDSFRIPQLYLYSRDDSLAPAPFIDELVQHRRDVVGSDRVIQRVWDKSRHCSHLLKHPKEYSAAVEAFVELSSAIEQGRWAKL